MTKDQLKKAKAITQEIDFINRSLDELRSVRTPYSNSPSGKSLDRMDGILAGFFDEDIYRLRVSAHIADLEKQLADI